jgi:hypothetical protein
VREVPEQITRGANTQPLQRLGPSLTDALEKLDRSIEPEGSRSGTHRHVC